MNSFGIVERVEYLTRLADTDDGEQRVLTVIEGKHLGGKQIIVWAEWAHGPFPSFGNFTVHSKSLDPAIYAKVQVTDAAEGKFEGKSLFGSPEAYKRFRETIWSE
ncbi:MAG: hypothetical protein Q7S84_04070 [bacterium]|nr:hypothetical protein [bacterium]